MGIECVSAKSIGVDDDGVSWVCLGAGLMDDYGC
jgi:hypothetical protein